MDNVLRVSAKDMHEVLSELDGKGDAGLYEDKRTEFLRQHGVDTTRDWYEWTEVPEGEERGDICFLNIGEQQESSKGSRLTVAYPVVSPGHYPPEVQPYIK